MNINKISIQSFSKLKRNVKIAAIFLTSSLPTKINNDQFVKMPKQIVHEVSLSSLTKGLDVVEEVNCRGGVTKRFSDSSLNVLKNRLLSSNFNVTYTYPIDTSVKPYIPSTGQFGSLRPQNRPHLGVDIYPRLYGRKPKQPVAVLSATDGIVVSVKKSPQKDPQNLIANNIKIMSPDGKIYSYDHLGRPEDYVGAKYTELKPLGAVVNAGDTLGTVGRTGETAVWHLHFGVSDLDAKQEQLKNPTWKKLFKDYSVYATPSGQVDPLDVNKAGDIADILNVYKLDDGPKVDYLDKL